MAQISCKGVLRWQGSGKTKLQLLIKHSTDFKEETNYINAKTLE